uniref:OSJNBb0040D15.4 protein n=1 Tax=Oryza sativa subsp. japonica TaxID=39947 RepID=Q7XMX0_ORYSJ|nr:OSJNBb0040D15.4 [Oryza sativa Japonica Group]
MARGPMDLWNEWATQILVLLSFTLQIILLQLAGIRRREAPAVLRLLLWLAYQLADSTAIYAICHLSLGGTPREHQLVAFWAPFLLLHLGGPDNITAYSLEDSKLWLRHLLTVVVQVLGAAYVLYKQFRGSGSPLLLATILMFVVGVVKYGERTWALMSGNIDTIRSTLKKEPHTKCHSHIEYKPHQMSFSNEGHFRREANEEEFLICNAHALFHICKYAVVDDSSYDNTRDTRASDAAILRGITDEQKYAVTEIELSLSPSCTICCTPRLSDSQFKTY